MITTTAPQIDLDANAEGVQDNIVRAVSLNEMAAGVNIFTAAAMSTNADARFIELVIDNAGIIRANDNLILQEAVSLRSTVALVTGKTVGGVSGLSYQSNFNSGKATVTLTKTAGDNFTGEEVRKILQAVRLQNTTMEGTVRATRNIDVRLGDIAGRPSADASRVVIHVDAEGYQLDLNADRAGIQLEAIRYVNAAQISAQALSKDGVSFVNNLVEPPASGAVTIRLSFNGISEGDSISYSSNGVSGAGGVTFRLDRRNQRPVLVPTRRQ
ncbi:hypothetical protein [Herbaspirillum sp. VT-16-41]|uniref:hypothetical protein n=1 Tax=Herbaspirillum sp. VT-16-41 TaxID=1953765 RepID=UPI00111592F1|nr:hypothetical protein [Herbaspirillum sp. VT-16-41]